MCGLYSFKSMPDQTRLFFDYRDEPNFPPRPYVEPGAPIAIVRPDQGERRFALVRWGLIPSWLKEIQPGKPLINARAETVTMKASFRHAMQRRRCLIPADGFYEWKGEPGRKQAYFVHRPDDGLFAFAGLWEYWAGADGSEIETAAIITTRANNTLAPIHERMPVVIHPQDFARWLDCNTVKAEQAWTMLAPAPDSYFIAETVRIERSRPSPDKVEADQLRLL